MRLMLASFTGLVMLLLTGCGANLSGTVQTPYGNITGTWTSPDATLVTTSGRVLYAPGQTHDMISGRALFAPGVGSNGVRVAAPGECASCRTIQRDVAPCQACESRAATREIGTVNPCAPVLEVKPSLRERVRNIFAFRSPHYIREIRNGGDTPVTRALRGN